MGGDNGLLDVEHLRRGVDEANIPALLMVLVQLTGDLGWLGERYAPTRTRGLSDHTSGGLPPEVQTEIRHAAFDAIVAWRGGRPLAIPMPDSELLVRMMSVCMGQAVPDEYGEMLTSELAIAEVPLLGPASRERERQLQRPAGEGPHVLVIGAGASGIIAAVYLQRAGIPFTIIEKN